MEPTVNQPKKRCELCSGERSLKDYFNTKVILCGECAIKHMNLLAVWMARVDAILKEEKFGRRN